VDWESIASRISHEAQPAFVVDARGRVRIVNAPMEKLVGRRLDELSAKRWLAACVPPSGWADLKTLLDVGLRGETGIGRVLLLTREGRRLTMHVELSLETRGRSHALLVVARELRDSDPVPVSVSDCRCVVSRGAPGGPVVVSLRFLDPSRDSVGFVGRPLIELLEELSAVAALPRVDDVIGKRSADASHVLLPEVDDQFRVVTAHSVDDGTVLVTVRCIDAALLPELVDARAARIAGTGGLSERERQVLTLLLRGHGVEDIALMLQIAPRTVKFHQSNVLQKLGADSRVDLLRVLL
jgi:DNA-binding CsgD family transcriptional regulator